MRSHYRVAAAVAAALSLVCLGGCISLLPKEKPAQLYRFGAGAPVAAAPAAGEARVSIRAAPTSFERAAAGDKILTASGNETAFIAGARWVTAASMLFDEAVTSAFQAHGGPARLLARDEPVAADYVLKLDVQTFEVRYDHGRGAAPTILVKVSAALVGRHNTTTGDSQLFGDEAPAESDSVHAIAAAFDVAVGKVLGEMITWVETKAGTETKAGADAKTGG
jgi:cholesterol transport system auxiliary component